MKARVVAALGEWALFSLCSFVVCLMITCIVSGLFDRSELFPVDLVFADVAVAVLVGGVIARDTWRRGGAL